MNKNAQNWSFDLLVAVGLFAIIFVVFYVLVGQVIYTENPGKMVTEAENLKEMMSAKNNSFAFIEDNTIKEDTFIVLSEKSYQEQKTIFGHDKEFCVYFVDDSGNLVKIDTKYSIGSPDANLTDDIKCGE